jgi:hypothetical protein
MRRTNLYRLYQDYMYKVPVILHDDLQRESYGPPTSVTWLQLLRKRMNTGTSTALTAETEWSIRAVTRHVAST